MNLTQILKERRQELGISQSRLAVHCGFANRGHISKLENGGILWKVEDMIAACELLQLKLIVEWDGEYIEADNE